MWPLLSTTKELLQYLTSYHMSITDNVAFVVHYQRAFSQSSTDNVSTTKESFTIPNILPYVHHWQCGLLCCPLPKSLLQYLTSYHMSITDNVVFVVHYQRAFTIPNILPYVHHWQCGLCCPLPKSLLQYLTSYHMSITDNVVFVVHYQRVFSYHMSITDNVVFVVHYQRVFYNT